MTFEELICKKQLQTAIKHGVEFGDSMRKKLRPGIVSCRYRDTDAFVFQVELESAPRKPLVFWNGKGTSLYYKFVPYVQVDFDPETERVEKVLVNDKEVDLSKVTLLVTF
jgi:hypothetical protein